MPGTEEGRPVMNLTDVFRSEHQDFYALLNEIEEMTSYAGELALLERAMTVLATEVGLHAILEEKLLFPALEPHVATSELFADLRADHQEIRRGLEQIEDAQDINEALEAVPEILDIARRHFQKEDEVLYAGRTVGRLLTCLLRCRQMQPSGSPA
jgi:iron-sulfur cluster repair protein YtfE (RIC family)